jgi:Immunity protein family (Imm11)
MTEAAKLKIGSLLQRYGEFLPLSCDDGWFRAFHVTHFVDALDENASEIEHASDDPTFVIGVRRHSFRSERLTPDWMFLLLQFRGHGPTYVTTPFVNMIRDSHLTGLEFKQVWPHS